MYNKITITETTEEAKNEKVKTWHQRPYSGIILALFFDGEEALRNRSSWICSGKVLPPQSEYPREVAKWPQIAALGNIIRDWKRAVSHLASQSWTFPRKEPCEDTPFDLD